MIKDLIIYEDEWLIAIDKPSGMLVHPTKNPEPDEQIALKALRNHLGQYLFVVHRLDRPTSGVLIFTKTPEVQSQLSILFQTWQVKKQYYAVVPFETPKEFSVDLPVKREETDEPMPSFTHFEMITSIPANKLATSPFTLPKVSPQTGRFHQIRRHLAWNNFPIMNDYLYGDIPFNTKLAEETKITRLMLLAKSIEFIHPVTQKRVFIETPFPQEFLKF